MADEEIQDVSAEPAGAPVNRDARRDPGVIEGEIAAREAGGAEPPPGPSMAAESGAEPRAAPAARPRAGARGFVAGAIAGLIVSALGAGAGYTLLASKADVSATANRLSAIEAQAQRDNSAAAAEANRDRAAVASLDKRVGALEASEGASGAKLDKRIGALEAASAGNGAAGEATQRLAVEDKDLRVDIDAERGVSSDLAARVAKLETDTPKTNAASADLGALSARIDKIDAALAAPKTETRAAPDTPSPSDSPAVIAIVAGAIADKLHAGAPFGPELAALERLGVDPARSAALRAVAEGAATNSALAASFDAVAPKVLEATSQPQQGGIADRFLAHIHNLVRVRDLSETAGDDPQALASQVEAESRRGDIAGALAAFMKLPEAARHAAGDWPAQARARQAAEEALQAIREAAIGRLAGGPKQ